MSSPSLPPEIGEIKPGNENRNRFFRVDFLSTSAPWCLITVLEGFRASDEAFAGASDSKFFEIASFLSRFRSSASGFVCSAADRPLLSLPPLAIGGDYGRREKTAFTTQSTPTSPRLKSIVELSHVQLFVKLDLG